MLKLINCGKKQFLELTKCKNIYCFGAGKIFRRFVAENPSLKISGVVDNFIYDIKEKIEVHEKIINVISLKKFEDLFTENSIVVITCLAYEEIIDQLDKIDKLDGMECYLNLFLEEYTEHFEKYPISKAKKDKIPRKIHYCWFGGKDLPDEYKNYIESWIRYCPGYEVIQWDESNYDIAKNQYVKQAYENKKWAFVSDYARVDIIHTQGGIYLDTDVELIKPFDEFLEWDMFCGFENTRYVNWGLGFGAVKGVKLLKNVLDRYEEIEFVNSDGTLNMLTCPVIQSKVMEQYGFKMNGLPQKIDNIAVYPKEFFAPYGCIKGFGRITENTHSIHHFSASWVDEDTKQTFSRWESFINRVEARNICTKE